ncbi:hypothetical protein [Micromonospora endolithica]|uniref:hypothetical protein n=1 Tax=Micromonospora endolithica TaxID=230091 RepID=UPI001EDD43CE|nr:hypothetical protein [Micromonospora endolithica]
MAALLHDAPDLVPKGMDIYQVLTSSYGYEVSRIIAALHAEHQALDAPDPPIRVEDYPVLLASTADKIVALTSLWRRARATGDVTAFLTRRPVLCGLLPHFRAFQQAARVWVPASMSAHLDAALAQLERAAAAGAR